MTNDQTEQRIKKLERTVDSLRLHLLKALELNYALAAELAQLKGQRQDTDPICIKAISEFTTLNTLRPIQK
jgi:regulator of replication initiation timing